MKHIYRLLGLLVLHCFSQIVFMLFGWVKLSVLTAMLVFAMGMAFAGKADDESKKLCHDYTLRPVRAVSNEEVPKYVSLN